MQDNAEDFFEFDVQQVDDEFLAHVQVEGKVIKVGHVLEGERVRIEIPRKKGRKKIQRGVEVLPQDILRGGELRVSPECAVFGVCGGCHLQHVRFEAQIELKKTKVQHFFEDVLGDEKVWVPNILSSPWKYRRKARLSVRDVPKKERVLVGFRERASSFVANMDSCPVLCEPVGQNLRRISDYLGALEIRAYVPQIEVAVGDTHGALVVRHLKPIGMRDLAVLEQMRKAIDCDIYGQSKGLSTIIPLGENVPRQLFYRHQAHDVRIDFEPYHFVQINAAVSEKMVSQAIEWLALRSSDNVLDLFSGLGNFSLPIARYAGSVLGVDFDEFLVAYGTRNAKLNGMSNVRFINCDLSLENCLKLDGFNKLLLDPARNGAGAVLRSLDLSAVEVIVYVSCNYKTLLEDVCYLTKQSDKRFAVDKMGVMDMFPHTRHVEVMCRLVRVA